MSLKELSSLRSKEDLSSNEKGKEAFNLSFATSTSTSFTIKEERLDAHGEHDRKFECSIPNIKYFNSNSSDSQDYLERE